jgi:hypothetical protein
MDLLSHSTTVIPGYQWTRSRARSANALPQTLHDRLQNPAQVGPGVQPAPQAQALSPLAPHPNPVAPAIRAARDSRTGQVVRSTSLPGSDRS